MSTAARTPESIFEADAAKRERSLPEILAEHAAVRPDAVAFRFLAGDGEVASTLTFGELDRRARAIATALRDFAGRSALLLYPSGPEFVAALFGCLRAGVVLVHAPLAASAGEPLSRAAAVAADCDAAIVLAADGVVRTSERSGGLAQLPWLATDVLGEADDYGPPMQRGEDLAVIQYTSGTTGSPRGIPLTHLQLTLQAATRHAGRLMQHDDIVVGWTPLFHDLGFFTTVLQPVYSGNEAVILSPTTFLARPTLWLQAISRFRGTVSAGPNFAYALCTRRITNAERAGLDLSCWRLAGNGAEMIQAPTLERFAETFGPVGFSPDAFCPGYGLAEATCVVSSRVPGTGAGLRRFDRERLAAGEAVRSPDGHPLASSGPRFGPQRWAVVSPSLLTELGEDRVGELWISGPAVASGYWNRPEEEQAPFRGRLANGDGPFLRTGDLVFLHEGELFVVGRLKDIILINGRNIFPQDVETTVQASHPALRPGCGAAFSVPGEDTELLVIMQELRKESDSDPAEVEDAIRTAVGRDHGVEVHALYLLPPRSVPKTTSGKLQRNVCRVHFLRGTTPQPPA